MTRRTFAIFGLIAMSLAPSLWADETRIISEGGIQYQEVRRKVQRPTYETTMQQTTQVYTQPEYCTETRDMVQTFWQPVTTYRQESYWVGVWNPFIEPYVETEWVPETTMQPVSTIVKMPVTVQRTVTGTRTVQTPVTTQKMVTEEIVVSRTPVANTLAASPVNTLPVGGVAVNSLPTQGVAIGQSQPQVAQAPPVQSAPPQLLTQQSTAGYAPSQNGSNPLIPYTASTSGYNRFGTQRSAPQNVPIPSTIQNPRQVLPSERVGGLARITQDPPRYGVSSPSSQWTSTQDGSGAQSTASSSHSGRY